MGGRSLIVTESRDLQISEFSKNLYDYPGVEELWVCQHLLSPSNAVDRCRLDGEVEPLSTEAGQLLPASLIDAPQGS